MINRKDELNNKKFYVYQPSERTWKYIKLNEEYLTNKKRKYHDTAYYELDLSQHDLLTEEVLKCIVPFLKKNPDIIKLDVSGGRIRSPGVVALARTITLRLLNLSDNRIMEGGLDGLQALAVNTTLKSLNLSKNKIGDKEVMVLAKHNQTLAHLNLSRNNIGDPGAIALAEGIPLLTHLYLNNNYISSSGATALAGKKTLLSLELKLNDIDTNAASALGRNTTLTSLDLSGNVFEVTALAPNTTLKSLSLSNTRPDEEAIRSLLKNPNLTYLDLSDAQITPSLTTVLAESRTLKSLKLDRNPIGDKGAIALANNPTLTSLSVCGSTHYPTEIGPNGATALMNREDMVVNMEGNNIVHENGSITIAGFSKVYVEPNTSSKKFDWERDPRIIPKEYKIRPAVHKINLNPIILNPEVARGRVGMVAAVLAQGARQHSFFGLPISKDITAKIAARVTNALSVEEAEQVAIKNSVKPKCNAG